MSIKGRIRRFILDVVDDWMTDEGAVVLAEITANELVKGTAELLEFEISNIASRTLEEKLELAMLHVEDGSALILTAKNSDQMEELIKGFRRMDLGKRNVQIIITDAVEHVAVID